MLAQKLMGSSAAATPYVDDVFATVTRAGTGASATVTTGFQPDLVWIKGRSGTWGAYNHVLYDSARGAGKALYSSSTGAENDDGGAGLSAFSSSGYSLGTQAVTNGASTQFVDWAVKKAPKFFDCVTYTGNYATGGNFQTLNHALGQAPGMILVKNTSTGGDWFVYHRSLGNNTYIRLNATSASAGPYDPSTQLDWAATATTFKVSSFLDLNNTGQTFVAYLFAHDTSTDGIIQCGSFAAAAGTNYVNFGFEPQFLIYKNVNAAEDWGVIDVMRGMPVSGSLALIKPNSSAAETAVNSLYPVFPTATGFGYTNYFSGGNTYIYLAIRRPNKPPTTGTSVYNAIARTGTGAAATVTGVGFAPDLVAIKSRSSTQNNWWFDKLRGSTPALSSNLTDSEATNATNWFGGSDLCVFGNDGSTYSGAAQLNANSTTYINHFFKRAPGVMDVVCYTGNSDNNTIGHSLSVAPELIILKNRSYAANWIVATVANGAVGYLNLSDAFLSSQYPFTASESSIFTSATGRAFNYLGDKYVAYLFATKAGIQKITSFVGNGSSQTIDCGFSTGARFVCIKATSTTGDWLIGDSTRGLVAGNDPRLSLNSTSAEVTSEDWLDPHSSGFIVNQVAGSNANVNGVTYLVWAIA